MDAALSYIDAEGLAGLSMRRLGRELGVEAMSLYRHVASKDQLLDAVVHDLMAQLDADTEVMRTPRDGWQDFLQRLAHGVRRIALAHPHAFPLMASVPAEAPWLRPPLRSLDWVEIFVSGLRAKGFTNPSIVAAYRAFTSFLLGHLLLEVAAHGAEAGPLDGHHPTHAPDHTTTHDPGADHLLVHELRSELSEDHAAAEFEEALANLLDRLQLLLGRQ